MTTLAEAHGYKDLTSFRAAINSDPKWTPKSEQQIIDDFAHYIHQMEPKLPELFTVLPKGPVTVEGIPDFDAATSTHYNSGTPDGKRAGRVVVAVANPTTRTLVLDEAVAYHEGVPGHHMQISVAQQFEGHRPKFRLRGGYSAYTEGWATGRRRTRQGESASTPIPSPTTGEAQLRNSSAPMRLVVDTGIHDKGWTRDQVIAYMHANDVNDASRADSKLTATSRGWGRRWRTRWGS